MELDLFVFPLFLCLSVSLPFSRSFGFGGVTCTTQLGGSKMIIRLSTFVSLYHLVGFLGTAPGGTKVCFLVFGSGSIYTGLPTYYLHILPGFWLVSATGFQYPRMGSVSWQAVGNESGTGRLVWIGNSGNWCYFGHFHTKSISECCCFGSVV